MSGAKYALVTGGNRGIGLEVCKQLVAKGKPVLFTARNAEQGGQQQGTRLKPHRRCSQLFVSIYKLAWLLL